MIAQLTWNDLELRATLQDDETWQCDNEDMRLELERLYFVARERYSPAHGAFPPYAVLYIVQNLQPDTVKRNYKRFADAVQEGVDY